jgi:hypothetical protein
MEAVSDLPRLRRTLVRALCIETTAVAADDFDLRMLAKPLGCPGGRAIRQDIDNLAPLQVDDDGPVSATLSPTPVIDARHSYSRLRMETDDLPFQMPQNGIVADRHAETFHQPFGRPATSAVAEKMNKLSDSLGPTSARTNNLRQLIRKRPTLTLSVQTSPTTHPHLHHHGGALHRQVLKMTEVSAVPTSRWLAASGTAAYFRSHGRDHPVIAIPLNPKNPHARSGSPIYIFSHPRVYRPRRGPNQTARKVRQTRIF